jgi:hypothetical protein
MGKTGHRDLPDTARLDPDPGIFQQLFYRDRAPSFLGIGRILVFFVGRAALGDHIFRFAKADALIRFRP